MEREKDALSYGTSGVKDAKYVDVEYVLEVVVGKIKCWFGNGYTSILFAYICA